MTYQAPTDDEQCTAKSKQSGVRCKRRRHPGATVCVMHGGRTPQVRRAVAVQRVESEARAALQHLHPDRQETAVRDPLEELAQLAGEVVAFKDYLRGQLDGLNGTLTYWTEATHLDADGETRTTAVENVRAVLAAYERALDRTTKVLATMVKLDLAGRIVALRETQATVLVEAIREGLAEVDMGTTVRRAVEAAIADKLAALADRPVTSITAG